MMTIALVEKCGRVDELTSLYDLDPVLSDGGQFWSSIIAITLAITSPRCNALIDRLHLESFESISLPRDLTFPVTRVLSIFIGCKWRRRNFPCLTEYSIPLVSPHKTHVCLEADDGSNSETPTFERFKRLPFVR